MKLDLCDTRLAFHTQMLRQTMDAHMVGEMEYTMKVRKIIK